MKEVEMMNNCKHYLTDKNWCLKVGFDCEYSGIYELCPYYEEEKDE